MRMEGFQDRTSDGYVRSQVLRKQDTAALVSPRPRRRGRPWSLRVALWSGVGFFTLLIAFPYLVMLATALKSGAELAEPAHWIPKQIDWSAITATFTHPWIWTYVRNSVILAGGTTALVMVTGVPAAYVLARHHFRGRKLFLDMILVTQMFSPVVLLIPLFRLFKQLGLLGTREGVILASAAFALPFSIWLLVGFFRAIPVELEEAAQVDGCGRLGILFRIILPLTVPGILATATWAFIIGWNEFIFAVTFLPGTPDYAPISVGILTHVGRWYIDWQGLMFMAIVGTVPVLAMFAMIQKQLDRGLSSIGAAE